MIRITKQTDYGIVLTSHMAGEAERMFTATELADETQLPVPMVSKILKHLARHGVLTSYRGANGGYALSRPPAEIAISEVITALEGPIAITECIDDGPGDCNHEPVCPMRGNWQVINRAVRRALAGITLADMARPLPQARLSDERLVTLGGGIPAAKTAPAPAQS
jgi:FeS assembly SUF system regulator